MIDAVGCLALLQQFGGPGLEGNVRRLEVRRDVEEVFRHLLLAILFPDAGEVGCPARGARRWSGEIHFSVRFPRRVLWHPGGPLSPQRHGQQEYRKDARAAMVHFVPPRFSRWSGLLFEDLYHGCGLEEQGTPWRCRFK